MASVAPSVHWRDFCVERVHLFAFFQVFKPRTPPEAITLCSRLLEYTPASRFSPFEACSHAFFDELRQPNTRLPNGRELPHLFNFSPTGSEIFVFQPPVTPKELKWRLNKPAAVISLVLRNICFFLVFQSCQSNPSWIPSSSLLTLALTQRLPPMVRHDSHQFILDCSWATTKMTTHPAAYLMKSTNQNAFLQTTVEQSVPTSMVAVVRC